MGCGSSVNAVTKEIYDELRPHVDVWGLNLLQWHPVIVPDFWHLEPMGNIVSTPSTGNMGPEANETAHAGQPLQAFGKLNTKGSNYKAFRK